MIGSLASLIILATTANAQTAPESSDLSDRLSSVVQASLSEKIAGAEIRLPSLNKLTSQPALAAFVDFKSARIVEDRPNGIAVVEVTGVLPDQSQKTATIQTPYEAWKKVPTATHRIYPNTRLKLEDFKVSEINVASGSAREYRGIMLSPDTDFSGMQTKQTILENQYAVSTAVEKQPDVRKGDVVRLQLSSGDLTLSTQATVQEPASIGDRVRVMTLKSKKEIVGKVSEDRSVEVSL